MKTGTTILLVLAIGVIAYLLFTARSKAPQAQAKGALPAPEPTAPEAAAAADTATVAAGG